MTKKKFFLLTWIIVFIFTILFVIIPIYHIADIDYKATALFKKAEIAFEQNSIQEIKRISTQLEKKYPQSIQKKRILILLLLSYSKMSDEFQTKRTYYKIKEYLKYSKDNIFNKNEMKKIETIAQKYNDSIYGL